jgi:dTDP-4-dehydrorhamnose 3,5-epimerase
MQEVPNAAASVEARNGDLRVLPEGTRDRAHRHPDGSLIDNGIEGVEYVPVRRHSDHRGSLIELINFADPFWREPIVHGEFVTTRPGRIKGWGMHKLSVDRYFVATGQMRVVLFDGRTASSTFERIAQFNFTDESPGMLRIPTGVWHANQNWGDTDAVFVNFPTDPHDYANPDKYRIDPHDGTIPFDWTLPDG